MKNLFQDPNLHTMIHDTNNGLGYITNAVILIEKLGPLNDKQKEYLQLIMEGRNKTLNAIDTYYMKLKENQQN